MKLSLIAMIAVGCGSSTSSATVSAIAVTPDPCAVRRTDSMQMNAEVTLPDGSKAYQGATGTVDCTVTP